jgi:uncharacterized protein
MKMVHIIAAVLVIVGALNWGLVGALNFNLVAAIFGSTVFSSIVYTLVGLSGVLHIFAIQRMPKAQTN